MIVEWWIGVVSSFVDWVASLFPTWSAPDLDPSSGIGQVVSAGASLGNWVPWTVLLFCVGVVVAAWLVTLGIKIVRALIAHVPEFGGAGD